MDTTYTWHAIAIAFIMGVFLTFVGQAILAENLGSPFCVQSSNM